MYIIVSSPKLIKISQKMNFSCKLSLLTKDKHVMLLTFVSSIDEKNNNKATPIFQPPEMYRLFSDLLNSYQILSMMFRKQICVPPPNNYF